MYVGINEEMDWIVNHPYLQVHMQGVGLGWKKIMHVATTKCVQCASHGTIQEVAIHIVFVLRGITSMTQEINIVFNKFFKIGIKT